MRLEGQLHYTLIHSKPVMKSQVSSAPIRQNGSLKREKWRGKERETDGMKVDKPTKKSRMIVWRILSQMEYPLKTVIDVFF